MSQQAYLMARWDRIIKDATIINFPKGGRRTPSVDHGGQTIPFPPGGREPYERLQRNLPRLIAQKARERENAAYRRAASASDTSIPAAVSRASVLRDEIDDLTRRINAPMPPVRHPKRTKTKGGLKPNSRRGLMGAGIAAGVGTGVLIGASAYRDRQQQRRRQHR